MTRATITLSDDLASMVRLEAQQRQISFSEVVRDYLSRALLGGSERRRVLPWAGLINDPTMIPAARMDDELSESWADAIDRDRG